VITVPCGMSWLTTTALWAPPASLRALLTVFEPPPPRLLKNANISMALSTPKTAASMRTPRFRVEPDATAVIERGTADPPLGNIGRGCSRPHPSQVLGE